MRDEEREEGQTDGTERRRGEGGLTYGVGRQICVTPRGSKLGDAWPAPQATGRSTAADQSQLAEGKIQAYT